VSWEVTSFTVHVVHLGEAENALYLAETDIL
jgi:hypothetical protein